MRSTADRTDALKPHKVKLLFNRFLSIFSELYVMIFNTSVTLPLFHRQKPLRRYIMLIPSYFQGGLTS